ncbi:dUTP diphosphatase [Pseudovirgaria hyperparasitica]|uniref:Deoxyuridine 5'-triphosphate nucleotidohydrolase n=1 Tax=Pseudovirgaria hyperparasitica TaxID=470096 RepID=A0A6A6W3U5_9PEZI|nr:dUTP diphosphatase [Pseudovirgaria hyperparasitica]KAF2756610.1 dUTP diphosphatase [Pseudovirgaria hyperparasitica]
MAAAADDSATPLPSTTTTHEPPSLPTSPHAKPPHARAPTRGSPHAAGHDLYSARTTTIPPWSRALIATDIAISVPAGTYGRVAPRSGLAVKHGIDTLAGVIDADYRGPVGVVLVNLSGEGFVVRVGERVAQLVVEKIVMPEVVVVEALSETVRGAGGFGSTGGFAGDGAGVGAA